MLSTQVSNFKWPRWQIDFLSFQCIGVRVCVWKSFSPSVTNRIRGPENIETRLLKQIDIFLFEYKWLNYKMSFSNTQSSASAIAAGFFLLCVLICFNMVSLAFDNAKLRIGQSPTGEHGPRIFWDDGKDLSLTIHFLFILHCSRKNY